MSGEQDPAFWRNLYRPPSETEADLESTGFHVAISADDLVAERIGANDGVKSAKSAEDGTASVDPAAVKAMVNSLLKKRLAELAAKGMLVAPGGSAGGSAARTQSRPSSQPHKPVAPTSAPSSAAGSIEEDIDHGSTAIEDELPPWEEEPELDAGVGLDTQASTLTIDDGDFDVDIDDEGDEELFVEVDDGDDDLFVEVEEDESDFVIDVAEGDEAGAGGDFDRLWQKVPILPGGQSSLIGVSGLSPSAPMVLVLIDGVSTLKGLKMLVPHVPNEEFEAIIEDGIARGLVVFD